MTQLCEFCLNLGFDRNIEDVPTWDEMWSRPQGERYCRYHNSRGGLEYSARNGCQLCGMFLRTLVFAEPDIGLPESEDWLNVMCYKDDQNTFTCRVQDYIRTIFSGLSSPIFQFYETREHWDENLPPQGNIQNIKGWLQDCVRNHAECQMEPPSTFIPTRLIDLDGSAGLRIVTAESDSGHGIPMEYGALSYCWGCNMPEYVKTTSHNIKSRAMGFQSSDLPQTLVDAIRITRQLGIRYIWIDVLCILQDSPDDWETESAKMSMVYGNAYCTLSVSAAADVGTGFPANLYRSSKRENQLLINSNTPSRRLVVSGPSGNWDNLDKTPVQKRGWTLQERFLSRRVIHFLNSHMEWECHKVSCTNKGPIEALKFPEQLSFPGSSLRDSNSPYIWNRLVENYSQRNLTVESDKLTAIAGVASAINSDLGDKYLAGLWLDGSHIVGDDLVEQLCWSVGSIRHDLPRPSKYRAPSWSWAAIDNWVGNCYYWSSAGEKERDKKTATVFKASVVDVSTHLATDDPYGQVSGGFLDISGPLRRIRLVSGGSGRVFDGQGRVFVSGHDLEVGYSNLDTLGDANSDREVFCFRMMSTHRPERQDEILDENGSTDLSARQQSWEKNLKYDAEATALILVQDDNDPACYRRIGLANDMKDEIFRGCPWETIRII